MAIRLYNDTRIQSNAIRLYSDRIPPEPITYKPPFLERVLPQTTQALDELGIDPLSLKANPKKALESAWNSIKETVLASRERFGKLYGPEYQKETVAGKLGLSTEALAGGVSAVLSPITALFTGAEDIPVLGTVSRLISLPFSAAGEGGSKIAGGIIDKLPISQESKDKLKPGIQEIFALAAQIALGKAEGISANKIRELTKKYGAKDAGTIIEKAQELSKTKAEAKPATETIPEELEPAVVETKIRLYPEELTGKTPFVKLPEIKPITVKPETKIYELRTEIGELEQTLDASPYKQLSKYAGRNKELPEVVGYGKSEYARRGDQIITELGLRDTNDASFGYERYLRGRKRLDELKNELRGVKKETFEDFTEEQLDKINSLIQVVTQEAEVLNTLRPIGTKETKTSGLALGVEEKAIENKLTRGFGDLPEYRTVNMADQASLANNFLGKNYEKAKKIALGQDMPPPGILPESLFIALENRAIKTNDVTTLRELATSGLVSEATAMGQRIRTLAERDSESPIWAMAEVKKARMERVKNPAEAQQKIKTEIKEEIKKTRPTKETWSKFIDSLIC